MKIVSRLVVVFFLIYNVSLVFGKELSPETINALFKARAEQIQNFSTRFDIQYSESDKRSYDVVFDVTNGNINSTRVQLTKDSKTSIETWVANNNTEWHAIPENAPEYPGTFIVEVSKRGQAQLPNSVSYNEHGIDWIMPSVVPYHIWMQKEQKTNLKESDMPISDIQQNGNLSKVTFQVKHDGKVAGELIYEIDLSDGFKIYSYEIKEYVSDKPLTVIRHDFTDFRKVNDIWFPYESHEQWWDVSGKKELDCKIKINQIEFNKELNIGTFTYNPPYGSRIIDKSTDMVYRIGSLNSKELAVLDESIGSQVPSVGTKVENAPILNQKVLDEPNDSNDTLASNISEVSGSILNNSNLNNSKNEKSFSLSNMLTSNYKYIFVFVSGLLVISWVIYLKGYR